MKTTIIGRHKKEYLIQLSTYGRYLEAEYMIVYESGSITLCCKEGYICYRYSPTAKELENARRNFGHLTDKEIAHFLDY